MPLHYLGRHIHTEPPVPIDAAGLQGKLKQFLALMPADDAQAGQQAAAGGYF